MNNVELDPQKLHIDPFIFDEVLEKNKNRPEYEPFMQGGSKFSNRDWKVMIDFKDVVYNEIQEFEDLAVQIAEQEEDFYKDDAN